MHLLFLFRKIPAGTRLLETEDQKAYVTLKRMIDERLSVDTEEKRDLERIYENVLECMRYKDNVSIHFNK